MATIRYPHQLYTNFSGGYACEQALITEKLVSFIGDSHNVDIYSTDNNNGYGFKKILGNTLYVSIENEKIKGLFEYKASKTESYLIIYTVNDTEGKLYYINEADDVILLKDGLNKDAEACSFVNFSQTLPDKRYLGIFSNGFDPLIKIEFGADPEIEIIDEKDSEERKIRSSILEVFYGRVWCGVEDRVHWSKSLDPFVWATEEDDAGWAQLDGDIVAMINYANGLIISTTRSVYFCVKDVTGTGFTFTVLSPNYAISSKGIVKHDKYALYMAEDGIYPVNITQEDTKKVDENISWIIQEDWISKRNKSRDDEIFALSVTTQGRNEIWFNIPMYGSVDKSYIFIYRFKKGRQAHYYWLPPRIQQKINCLIEFNGRILSGTDNGEILQELTGKTFNGRDISAVAELPILDFNGTYNKQKFKLFLYSELDENNKFFVDYFYDGDNEYDRQEVVLENKTFCWNIGSWDEDKWSPLTILEYQLDKPRKHKSLKIRFVAENSNQDFIINQLATTKIKVKNK